METENFWLSRFAKLVVFATFCLILLGGMVTSLGAGLAVPDWPTTYGYNMFAFPLSRWVGPVFWEHCHRLVASLIGFLTIALAVWTWRAERRRWVSALALGALALVIVQGILGGLRVTHLSIALAMVHGCVAQAFLCVLTLLALALAPSWETPLSHGVPEGWVRSWKPWAWLLAGAVYLQLILGAVMRHLGAGLAIPTFPLSGQGTLIPRVHNPMVDIHFAHRVWALVVTGLALVVVAKVIVSVRAGNRVETRLLRPALWLTGLLSMQIVLGASVIWLMRSPLPTSLHVLNGAAVLMISFILAVRGSRFAFLANQSAGLSTASEA